MKEVHKHNMHSLSMFTDEQIEAFEVEWYTTEEGGNYMKQKEQHLKNFIHKKMKNM